MIDKEKDRAVEIEKALIAAEARDQSAKLALDQEKIKLDAEARAREIDVKNKKIDTDAQQQAAQRASDKG